MENIIVFKGAYKPNTAPMNRLLSMLNGFDELGVEVEMVFAYTNNKGDYLDESQYKNVKINNLWRNHHVKNKWFRYLVSFWDTWRYVRKIADGSRVFLSGSNEYVPLFVGRKGLRVYHERTEHYNVVKLKPGFLQRWYLKSITKLDGMFVITTALKEAFEAIGASNVEVVNMTVDANRFVHLKKQVVEHPYIAYCGTASNNKDGVDDLIKAFSIVHKKYQEIKLFIIGKAPTTEDESGNLKLVKDLGMKESVVFTGVIPAPEMPQLLKNASMLALARPDSQQARCGFATKLGEYLLTGNPVVITKVGDFPLFLEDKVSARFAEQRNPEDFAEKMMWVLEHPAESEAIGQAGKQVALQHFNYKTETEKIVNTIFPDR